MALVRTDVLEKRIASIFRVARIGELGTTLTVTNNRSKLRRNIIHGVTSQKTAFFIVVAVKTSNLT
jgi:chemotaxis methyl-accepting protein methylase